MKKVEWSVASSVCQKYEDYNGIKGNSSTKRKAKASKGEIKGEQRKSYLAYIEQR